MDERTQSTQFIKPSIRSSAPALRLGGVQQRHRLQWNENPYDFPADLKEEVLQRMAQRAWAHYPETVRPLALIEALARQHAVAPEMVVVSGGSSSLIKVILSCVLEPGDRMVLTSPTFLLYRRNAALLGAELHEVPAAAKKDFALPVDDLIVAARTHEAKLVALCAPNNPTGTVYPVESLRRVVDECGALVLIDEAYAEYCGQNLRPLLDEFDNLVLVRTMSKAFAMAGLRVGYALTNPALAAELDKNVNSFPISTFSETVAAVAIEHHSRFMDAVARVVAERARLAAALGVLPGVRVFSSGANFVLAEVGEAATPIFTTLRDEHGILINNMSSYPELPQTLRISIGLPEENDRVIQVVAQEMARVG